MIALKLEFELSKPSTAKFKLRQYITRLEPRDSNLMRLILFLAQVQLTSLDPFESAGHIMSLSL
jgi:hypothetical protein